MSYGPGHSSLLTGTVAGVGVWIGGYLVALAVVLTAAPIDGIDFSAPGFAAAVQVTGTVAVLLSLSSDSFSLAWLVPSLAGLILAAAGGAIAVSHTGHLTTGWAAAKAGAAVCIGICLTSIVVMAVYLVPSTPFSNTPVSIRYMMILFGNLLLPGLFGALGGTIQYELAARDR